MSSYHVAQLNIGRLLAPLDSPQIADFVAALDPINALADAAPGFVWRLQDDDGNAISFRPFADETLLINMSVWESIETLEDYVYRSEHVSVLRRRREWFEKLEEHHMVLWWIPIGHRPDLGEAKDRLDRLRRQGPTAAAFTFRHRFPAPAAAR